MKDLLFLHAFPLDATMWRPQILALRGRARMLAVDFPGFGAEPLGSAATLDDYADHAARALDRAGVRRAVVCGLSMGGYVAFSFLRRHRERVDALILADTRAEADSPETVERRRHVAEQARRGGAEWMADNLPPLLSDVASANLRERVRVIVRAQSGEAIARASLAMADRPDSRPLLASIDVATLVIVGAMDTITPPASARVIVEGVRGARLVELPQAGHLANLEAPDGFAEALLGALG